MPAVAKVVDDAIASGSLPEYPIHRATTLLLLKGSEVHMVDLYTLFTGSQYQERIFSGGFPKEYVDVGPRNNRISQRVEAGEVPTISWRASALKREK